MRDRFYTRAAFAGREPNYPAVKLPSFATIAANDAAYREKLVEANECMVASLARYFANGGRG